MYSHPTSDTEKRGINVLNIFSHLLRPDHVLWVPGYYPLTHLFWVLWGWFWVKPEIIPGHLLIIRLNNMTDSVLLNFCLIIHSSLELHKESKPV